MVGGVCVYMTLSRRMSQTLIHIYTHKTIQKNINNHHQLRDGADDLGVLFAVGDAAHQRAPPHHRGRVQARQPPRYVSGGGLCMGK